MLNLKIILWIEIFTVAIASLVTVPLSDTIWPTWTSGAINSNWNFKLEVEKVIINSFLDIKLEWTLNINTNIPFSIINQERWEFKSKYIIWIWNCYFVNC